jgi:hypothetical protein
MGHRFRHHYTREEARTLLPQLQTWLAQLQQLRRQMGQSDEQVAALMKESDAVGGRAVNDYVTGLAGIKGLLAEFQAREIQIKDLDRGLIDFPSLLAGREVFLCWELGEDDVEFWHDLDTGFAGRERL